MLGQGECGSQYARRLTLEDLDILGMDNVDTEDEDDMDDLDEDEYETYEQDHRELQKNSPTLAPTQAPTYPQDIPYVKNKFNIYHIDLIPSIHWYAYKGSLTQPPCSRIVHWRVYDRPMKISPQQLQELQILLARGPCKDSPYRKGLGSVVARLPQDFDNRIHWHCTEKDFLSDCERFGLLCPAPPK